MARPKKEARKPSARDKIAAAFWRQLSVIPFSQMTARGIAVEAGVNHNTFYRHFDSIEDLAKQLFDESIFDALPSALLNAHGAEEAAEAVAASRIGAQDMAKAALYARSRSNLLIGLVRDALKRAWLNAVGVKEEALDDGQRADLAIIFGGLVAAMADPRIKPSPTMFAGVMSRPLGAGMVATLAAMRPADDTETESANRK